MKFLFLCHSLNIGGIETYILRFVKWLKQTHPGHELHVVCKSGTFGPYEADFREVGIHLHAMPLGYFNPLHYFDFYTFLRRSHFDVVCDFGGDFGALTMVCTYAAKVPRRLIFYRNARDAYKTTSLKMTYQLMLNRIVRVFSTEILSNSREALVFYYPDYSVEQDPRFKVIPNGIPLPDPLSPQEKEKIRLGIGIPENSKMVIHVGSGRWEKNHALILKVAKMCKDDGLKVCFYLVGPDVEKNYGNMAAKFDLNNICFAGVRRDVDKLLQSADLFFFPSLTEGQPNALLEAMVAGLPFIASNIGPIQEILPASWGDKWLFGPNNSRQAFKLLKDQLNNNYNDLLSLKNLTCWSRNIYNEDKCFSLLFNIIAE